MQRKTKSFFILHSPFCISRWQSQRGQIALIVLLLSAVMLTMGITVVQKSLFDTKVSEQEEQASRAFQAAETGVEQALRTLTESGGDVSVMEGVSYKVTISNQDSGSIVTSNPLAVGEILEADLTGTAATAADIYFHQNTGNCANGGTWGLEVELVTKESGDRVVHRAMYMSQPEGNYAVFGQVFCKFIDDFPLLLGKERLRVRPVGEMGAALPTGTLLAIVPQPTGTAFVGQYQLIRSEGKTQTGVTRVVNVTRSVPQLLTIFDYALFSGGGVEKAKPAYPDYVPDPSDFLVENSVPAGSAIWPAPPVNVLLTFNMELDPTSTVNIIGPSGSDVSSGVTTFDVASLTMRRAINGAGLGSGNYQMQYSACVVPGNCKTDTVPFAVNTGLQTAPIAYTNRTDGGGGDSIRVLIQSTGLDIPRLIVDAGDKVRWVNRLNSGKRRVVSDYHPDHLYYPNLRSKEMLPNGGEDTITLTAPGVYYYHIDNSSDDLAVGYEGIVVVK